MEWKWIPIVFISSFVISGCATKNLKQRLFSKADVIDSVEVPIHEHMFSGKYYRISFDSVSEKIKSLNYLGTEDSLNVFMAFAKVFPPDAVLKVVMTDSQCQVFNKRNIRSEFLRYGTSFRPVNIYKSKCIVFGDSVQNRFNKLIHSQRSVVNNTDSLWTEAIGNNLFNPTAE